MKIYKDGDLTAYFNEFFSEIQQVEQEEEYKTALKLVVEFGEYIDQMARSNPHMLHHVYEWNMVGVREGRLFDLRITPTNMGSTITYEFLKSVMPNDNGVVFADKAQVMEDGNPVSFETDTPVPLYDGTMFRVGRFTFVPGGQDVGGSFALMFRTFFTNRQNIRISDRNIPISSLTKSGGRRDGKAFYDRLINK